MALLPRNFQQIEPQAVLVYLAVEGEVTEKHYFDTVADQLEEESEKRWRIICDATPHGSGLSSPRHVVDRAKAFRNLHPYTDPDRVWLVMDMDTQHVRHLDDAFRAEIATLNFRLGLSNPCFELWLWLHHNDIDPSLSDAKSYKSHLNFNWDRWTSSGTEFAKAERIEAIRAAIRRVEALPGSNATPLPKNPGTQLAALFRYLGFAD